MEWLHGWEKKKIAKTQFRSLDSEDGGKGVPWDGQDDE